MLYLNMKQLKQLAEIDLDDSKITILNDKERPNQPKKLEDGKLEALLEEYLCQISKS